MRKVAWEKLTAVCMAVCMTALSGCAGMATGGGDTQGTMDSVYKDTASQIVNDGDVNESDEGSTEAESYESSEKEATKEEVKEVSQDNMEPVGGAVEVQDKKESTVVFYNGNSANVGDATVYFFNGNESVAYMELEELFGLLSVVQKKTSPDYSYECEYDGKTFRVNRENGTSVIFDFEQGTMDFDDLYMFSSMPEASSAADLLTIDVWQRGEDGSIRTGEDGEKLIYLLSRVGTKNNFSRTGYGLIFYLSDYHIPVYFDDGKGYIPVATFSDMFLTATEHGYLSYNEGRLFLMEQGGPDIEVKDASGRTMADIWYDISATERTEELSEFNYWELVLFLNANYGLKEEHNIETGFDEYLDVIGLKDKLLSTDPKISGNALAELLIAYFGDIHSGNVKACPYLGKDWNFMNVALNEEGELYFTEIPNMSVSWVDHIANMSKYSAARKETDCMDEDGNPIPYIEVGNTAYVTFDQFIFMDDLDLYDEETNDHLEDYISEDTAALISYANREITREGSPIENVVVDLSNNSGGLQDAAVYAISWLIGTCYFSIVNQKTDAQGTVIYKADVDLDGKITQNDSLDPDKYKVFCLESPSSFSCGNLVPCYLKQSGKVTLMGQTSGGGACVVRLGLSADGTFFQISGMSKIATVKNGSYYAADEGAEPDVCITDPVNFYDRKKLTEYINGLI